MKLELCLIKIAVGRQSARNAGSRSPLWIYVLDDCTMSAGPYDRCSVPPTAKEIKCSLPKVHPPQCFLDLQQANQSLTQHSSLPNLGDPWRPPPPQLPYHLTGHGEPDEISLGIISYSGRPIAAWNLEACLTHGFKSAADVLSEDESPHRTGLEHDEWTCAEDGIEIALLGDRPGLEDLDFFDLASFLTLISEFHQRYAMRGIEFDVLRPRSEAFGKVGHGWVELSANGGRVGNATTAANVTVTATA